MIYSKSVIGLFSWDVRSWDLNLMIVDPMTVGDSLRLNDAINGFMIHISKMVVDVLKR